MRSAEGRLKILRGGVLVLLFATLWAPGGAWARGRITVHRLHVAHAVRPGGTISITGALAGTSRPRAVRLRVERRTSRRWRRLGTKRAVVHRAFRIRVRAPRAPGMAVLRLVVLRGGHRLLVTRVLRVVVRARTVSPKPSPPAVVPPQPPSSSPVTTVDGPSATVDPGRTTVLRNRGFALTVPAGTVAAPATATVAIAPSDDPGEAGPSADFHIDADWQDGHKLVDVTLPLPDGRDELGAGWTVVVLHDVAPGDPEILSGSALHIDEAAGTVTVRTTTLSRFHATLAPVSLISAPTASMRTRDQAVRLLRSFTGQEAPAPTCDPPADRTRVTTSGNALEPELLRGNEPRIEDCLESDGGGIRWRLANNSGAVLHVTASDDAEIAERDLSSDLLVEAFYELRDGTSYPRTELDLPPGGTVTITVPAGSAGHVSFTAAAVELLPTTFVLAQIGSLVPGESDAKKLYNALNGCGYALGVSLEDLTTQLRCAQVAAGIAGTRIAKAIDKPLLFANALTSELDTLQTQVDPMVANVGVVAADALGSVRSIDARTLPGASWSLGLDDSGIIVPTFDGGVLSITCTSTKSVADDPLIVRLSATLPPAWMAPVGIDNTSYGCPGVVVSPAGTTFVQFLAADGFRAEAIAADGRVLWSRPFPNGDGSPLTGATPALHGGNLYFPVFDGYHDEIQSFDAATGAYNGSIDAYMLEAMQGWSGGIATVDLGGGYRPSVRYFDAEGHLDHEYAVDDAVAANNGTWSFAPDADGAFLVSGASDCEGTPRQGHFAVEKIGPGGRQWTTTDPATRLCDGGSAVAPDTQGGAYLTASAGGDVIGVSLARVTAGGVSWHRALPGTSGVGGIRVASDGEAVTAEHQPYPCTPGGDPNCTGSVLAFTGLDGAPARADLPIEDPDYVSYYQGIDAFGIAPGSVYVIRGAGDYHDETASVSRIAVPGLKADYRTVGPAG